MHEYVCTRYVRGALFVPLPLSHSLGDVLDLRPIHELSLLAARARRLDEGVPCELIRALEVSRGEHRRQRYVVYPAL